MPGRKRPSNPLTFTQLHRLLRNPYYKGVVTYRGVTYPGTHPPLVSIDLWNQVQAVLTAQNVAGEKRRQHHHYLKGTIFCPRCGSRLIVHHAKNRHGTIYQYFMCIGRHQKRTDCQQAAMPIEYVEALIEDYYAGIRLTADRVDALRRYVHDGLSAHRADAELERRHQQTRLASLDNERRKLLQAHYSDAIPLDLLKTEQDRIATEIDTAQRRLDAVAQTFIDIDDTLEQALALGRDCHQAYPQAGPKLRRQLNQAFFEKLYVGDDGTLRAELAEPFAILLGEQLAAEAEAALATPAPKRHDPPPQRTAGDTRMLDIQRSGFECESFGGPNGTRTPPPLTCEGSYRSRTRW